MAPTACGINASFRAWGLESLRAAVSNGKMIADVDCAGRKVKNRGRAVSWKKEWRAAVHISQIFDGRGFRHLNVNYFYKPPCNEVSLVQEM